MTTAPKAATSKLAQVAKLQKTCLGPCGKMRPAQDFAIASNRPDGLQTWCRDCVRASERIRSQRLEAFGETDAMKLAEAALMLGVPQYRVKKMCERGELRCVDIGTSGSVFWRISRTHVLELLAAQQTTDGTDIDGQPVDDAPVEPQPEAAATGGGSTRRRRDRRRPVTHGLGRRPPGRRRAVRRTTASARHANHRSAGRPVRRAS